MKISNRLKQVLVVSVILHWLHFIEIFTTKYYLDTSAFTYQLADLIGDKYEATYLTFHITMYVLLTLFFIVIIQPKTLKYALVLYSWILISETHHIFDAIRHMSYVSGSITSLLYLIIVFFYFRTLFLEWKKN